MQNLIYIIFLHDVGKKTMKEINDNNNDTEDNRRSLIKSSLLIDK